jgi:hypothetical protein
VTAYEAVIPLKKDPDLAAAAIIGIVKLIELNEDETNEEAAGRHSGGRK